MECLVLFQPADPQPIAPAEDLHGPSLPGLQTLSVLRGRWSLGSEGPQLLSVVLLLSSPSAVQLKLALSSLGPLTCLLMTEGPSQDGDRMEAATMLGY